MTEHEELLAELHKKNIQGYIDGVDNGWWEEYDDKGPIKTFVGLWKDYENKTQAQAIVELIQKPYTSVFSSINQAKKAGFNKPCVCDSVILLNKGRIKIYIDKE